MSNFPIKGFTGMTSPPMEPANLFGDLENKTPKPGLEYTYKTLLQTAKENKATLPQIEQLKRDFANRAVVPTWVARIEKAIKDSGVGGGSKGPQQEALAVMRQWITRGLECYFNLGNNEVADKFASVIMLIVTEGFEGKQTGGTTLGNYSGGGYGAYDSSNSKNAPILGGKKA